MLCLKVMDRNEKTVAVSRGEREVNLAVAREYQEGDRILLEIPEKEQFLWLRYDDALEKSLVFMKGNGVYHIPFGEKRINLAPKAFCGDRHLISVRAARDFEIASYRNLALNPNDQHGNQTCYPHASANVETRGESVFAAQNAIDGITANGCHGAWPYASWGINQNPNAEMKLDFGREVEIDRIVIYLRADFPHDNWWKSALVTFSDESSMELSFQKTECGQEFTFDKKIVSWLKFARLIPAEDNSPFPALTQIEIYGKDL